MRNLAFFSIVLVLVFAGCGGDDSGSVNGVNGSNGTNGTNGTGQECTPSCTAAEYCDYAANCGLSDPGTCSARPTGCSRELAPVCGCDGITYGNECLAQEAGSDSAATGACQGAATCGAEDPCVVCDVNVIPDTADGCYCPACGGTAMTQSECTARTIKYNKICGVEIGCPPVDCKQPPVVRCDSGVCVADDPDA